MRTKPKNFVRRRRAFSLLEVMIATAIFFIGVFTVLSLVSSSLANARRLHRPLVDAGPVLATWASTNILVEGTYPGNMSDILGDAYRDYTWTAQVVEVATNKLFSVECVVQSQGSREIVSDLTSVFYRPQSPPGSLDGGNFIHK
jgi:hypothetical protein